MKIYGVLCDEGRVPRSEKWFDKFFKTKGKAEAHREKLVKRYSELGLGPEQITVVECEVE